MKNKARHGRIKHSALPPATIDSAFFESHPDKTQYRRKVVTAEVPHSLRKLGVCTVHVSRIDDGILLQFYIDANGRAVGQSSSINDRMYSTAERDRMAQVCQIAFNAFLSTGGE